MVSFSWPPVVVNQKADPLSSSPDPAIASSSDGSELDSSQAEGILEGLAGFLSSQSAVARHILYPPEKSNIAIESDPQFPNLEARYRALVEQIPAVVFMAYLDRGIGEAYVSPQIEAALGFSQEEWLEDPVRWYRHIHPDDKQRWSSEAAEMFMTGKALRSAYRVISRDGRVLWFHCEAKMIRKEGGEPWFIHGVGFDITDLKQTEEALQKERNVVSAILDTVGALVIVLDSEGRITRFNRACEQTTEYSFDEVRGKRIWDVLLLPEEARHFEACFQKTRHQFPNEYESGLLRRDGQQRTISWSTTMLPGGTKSELYIVACGIDITERKHLEKAILEISAREQRQIGQDLHDGLGQHLTGIAFMGKVQEQKLLAKNLPEAAEAGKIVTLVNEAIHKTRQLARGLLPVVADAQGLMSALRHRAVEIEDLFGVCCRFRCMTPVLIHDDAVAAHLYYIAQEAVNNAVKHARANQILIDLAGVQGEGSLVIEDDGGGIPEIAAGNSGMGLHLMNYRARMIGGSLQVQRLPTCGTRVTCAFPIRSSIRV